MKNTKLFTQFSYLVTNRFAFKDKNVVKVFYIYKDIYNIVLSLDIKKVKDHGFDDETYYINEAKKTVTKMINDGSLKKYSEKYIKEKKKNKILRSLLLVLGACALIGACIGTYYALNQPVTPEPGPEPEPTTYSISMVTEGATISPSTFISTDEKYTGTINVTATDKVLSGDPSIKLEKSGTAITNYVYNPSLDYKSAQLTIEKQYITDNITVEVTLADIHHISMITEGADIEEKELPTDQDYVGTISVTDDNKILNGLTSVTLKDSNTEIKDECTYEEQDDKTASLEIPLEYLTNDIEVTVALINIDPHRKEVLTFECETAGSLGIYYHSAYKTPGEVPPTRDIDVSYQIDDGEWQDLDIEQHFADTPTEYAEEYMFAPNLEVGQKVRIRGDNEYWSCKYEGEDLYEECLTFVSGNGGKFKVSNNVMSLLSSDNFVALNTATDYGFIYLFGYNGGHVANISDASDLYLPTNLADTCFDSMFMDNTNLVAAPALPATTLEYSCYYYMFEGCTSLVNAPALPAETLADYCYFEMFMGCTSLVNAPALPATELAYDCYEEMFKDCTSLVNAPALPADDLTDYDYCYNAMFEGCTSLVNAPELSATNLADSCYASMFNGCIALEEAPELPAETLVDDCYNSMFKGCTSLTVLPELPATELVSGCYYEMFSNCTAVLVYDTLVGNLIFTCPEIPEEVFTNPVENMFEGISGSPTPVAGTTYYYVVNPNP